MSNIIFTNKCNIQCPFCFATENNKQLGTTQLNEFDINKVLEIDNFLVKDGEFRFCGGEPTVNPAIVDVCKQLLENNRRVFIMTNGIWNKHFSDFILNLESKYQTRIGFLFNILEPEFYSNTQLRTINKSLSIVNPCKITLGFTIYKKEFNYEYFLDLALKYNIRNIRWSIASPNISHLHNDLGKDFSVISKSIYKLQVKANELKLNAFNDCGYIPVCFFENNHINYLDKFNKNSLHKKCMGSSVDIDTNGDAWRCFGLYSILKNNIKNFSNEIELANYFNRRVRLFNNIYPYSNCKSCKNWQKVCGGGCYAIRIKKALQQNPKLCLFPIDDDNEVLKCKPKRRSDLVIKSINMKRKIFYGNSVIEEPDENKVAFLNEIDGNTTISQLIERWGNNFSSSDKAKGIIIDMCRQLFEKDIILINYDYKYDAPSSRTC